MCARGEQLGFDSKYMIHIYPDGPENEKSIQKRSTLSPNTSTMDYNNTLLQKIMYIDRILEYLKSLPKGKQQQICILGLR